MDTWVWACLLLGLGSLLIILEFFIPSAGVIGVMAGICLLAAVIIGYLDGVVIGTVILAIEVIGVPLVLAAMVRVWPHTPIGRYLFLAPPEPAEVIAYSEKRETLASLIGMRGIAKSKMLPSGVVRIEGKNFDAMADGEAIEPGEAIIVKSVQMNCLIVRKERSDFEIPNSTDDASLLQRSLDELGLSDFSEDKPSS